MSDIHGISLATVAGFPQAVVRTLAQDWITTIDQLIAACATAPAKSQMAAHLGISASALNKLLELAKSQIPSSLADDLSRPVDTRERGLGAMLPDS